MLRCLFAAIISVQTNLVFCEVMTKEDPIGKWQNVRILQFLALENELLSVGRNGKSICFFSLVEHGWDPSFEETGRYPQSLFAESFGHLIGLGV